MFITKHENIFFLIRPLCPKWFSPLQLPFVCGLIFLSFTSFATECGGSRANGEINCIYWAMIQKPLLFVINLYPTNVENWASS
jgi:hypothetical protein